MSFEFINRRRRVSIIATAVVTPVAAVAILPTPVVCSAPVHRPVVQQAFVTHTKLPAAAANPHPPQPIVVPAPTPRRRNPVPAFVATTPIGPTIAQQSKPPRAVIAQLRIRPQTIRATILYASTTHYVPPKPPPPTTSVVIPAPKVHKYPTHMPSAMPAIVLQTQRQLEPPRPIRVISPTISLAPATRRRVTPALVLGPPGNFGPSRPRTSNQPVIAQPVVKRRGGLPALIARPPEPPSPAQLRPPHAVIVAAPRARVPGKPPILTHAAISQFPRAAPPVIVGVPRKRPVVIPVITVHTAVVGLPAAYPRQLVAAFGRAPKRGLSAVLKRNIPGFGGTPQPLVVAAPRLPRRAPVIIVGSPCPRYTGPVPRTTQIVVARPTKVAGASQVIVAKTQYKQPLPQRAPLIVPPPRLVVLPVPAITIRALYPLGPIAPPRPVVADPIRRAPLVLPALTTRHPLQSPRQGVLLPVPLIVPIPGRKLPTVLQAVIGRSQPSWPLMPDLIAAAVFYLRQQLDVVTAFGDSPATPKFFADKIEGQPDPPWAVYVESDEVPEYQTGQGFPAPGQFTFNVTAPGKLNTRRLAGLIAHYLDDAPLFFADGQLMMLRVFTKTKQTVLEDPGPGTNGTVLYTAQVTFDYMVQRSLP